MLRCWLLAASQAGADVDSANNNGMTPLMLASKGGHADVVKLLLDSGASVWLKTEDGRTALHKVSCKASALNRLMASTAVTRYSRSTSADDSQVAISMCGGHQSADSAVGRAKTLAVYPLHHG